MELYRNKYRIESTRLKNWDYSTPGYYFFTICTQNRINLFGEIINKQILINDAGKIVWDCWYDLPAHYPNLVLDEFIVMPNHIHGIICIIDNDRSNDIVDVIETGLRPVSTNTNTNTNTNKKHTNHGLSEFIRALKSFSARRINKMGLGCANPIWQTRFHDHIIRNHDELCRIRQYIKNNPVNWQKERQV